MKIESVFDNSSYNDVYFTYIGEVKDERTKDGRLARLQCHSGNYGN